MCTLPTPEKATSKPVPLPIATAKASAAIPVGTNTAGQGKKKRNRKKKAMIAAAASVAAKPTPAAKPAVPKQPAIIAPKPAASSSVTGKQPQPPPPESKGKEPAIYPSPASTPSVTVQSPLLPSLSQIRNHNGIDEAEFQLLDDGPIGAAESSEHELKTAPLFTRDAKVPAGFFKSASQFGVLGTLKAIRDQEKFEKPTDPRIYVNTNAPFSAIVCGVQGSGKSHTVSVLLENMLIPGCPAIGMLEKPLAGLVLHLGPGGKNTLPCEAAWLGKAKFHGLRIPPVRVYVSGSALGTMKRAYAPLGENVTVEPLLFTESELDAEAFLSMMAVDSSERAPLYMQVILSILRKLGEDYTYRKFLEELEEKKKTFDPTQKSHLEQRMALLKTFTSTVVQTHARFVKGQLTIVDLTDPFIDPASACGLFEIVTRLFVRADVTTGKVLLVDEAHKYLSASASLTEALLSLSRQMRHHGMRVIISSQEPTVVPPVLLDLCNVAIMHRFSSISWWNHVAKHFSADLSTEGAFDEVVKLKTGEAIVLAPSSLTTVQKPGSINPELDQLGRRYMLVKIRTRVTQDGGASIMVV